MKGQVSTVKRVALSANTTGLVAGNSSNAAGAEERTSLKAGTVMGSSNLSLHTWFTAFLLMFATKKGFSCLEFQRQLGLSRYETAFNLMHKIRSVMGKRDDMYMLQGMVEYDEAYVEKATSEELQKHLKRDKGSQRQAIVAVAAESTPLEDPDTGK